MLKKSAAVIVKIITTFATVVVFTALIKNIFETAIKIAQTIKTIRAFYCIFTKFFSFK